MHVSVHGDKYDCRRCRFNHHCDEDRRWPGSKGPGAFAISVIPGVIESRTCLLPMVSDFSRAMLRLYGHYKNHMLPFAGGLLEQPEAFVQAMEIIDQAHNQLIREIAERENGRIQNHYQRGR